MSQTSDLAPLLVSLELTPEQRNAILRQTGLSLGALPFASKAAVVRTRFAGVPLRVTRGVFTPTRITERLFDVVLEAAAGHRQPVVVDVGAGCGAVALAVATALPRASVVGIEISEVAVRCARRNRDRLGLHNVSIRRGSLLSPLPGTLRGKVTVIAGNLPYVPPELSDAARALLPEGTAIGPGADGLDLIRELARSAREFLVPGGSLALQMTSGQWQTFADELRSLGYGPPILPDPLPKGATVGRVQWSL